MAYRYQGGRGRGGGYSSRGHSQFNSYSKKTFDDLPNDEKEKTISYMISCLKDLITLKGRKFVNDGNISWANDPFTQFSLSKLNEKLRKQGKPTYDNNGFITNKIYNYPGRFHSTHTFFKTMNEWGLLDLVRSSNDEHVLIKPHDNAFDLLQEKLESCKTTSSSVTESSSKGHTMISSDEDDDDDDDDQ